MAMEIINKEFLAENDCFGCGHDNPAGLKIEVFRDPGNSNQLLGRFQTSRRTIGFPGITHGGAIYTAMDCLASWVPTILRSEIKAAWSSGRQISSTFDRHWRVYRYRSLDGLSGKEGGIRGCSGQVL